MTGSLRTIAALVRRALNEVLRVPGGAIPGVLAPSIFMLGIAGVFGASASLPGFPDVDFKTYILPAGFLQAATFAGAATGVNLARDIEQGWFDRLLVAPAPRTTLLAGIVASASLRSLMPTTLLVLLGLALGVRWPGGDGLLVGVALEMTLAAAAACWGVAVALRFRTQQAAPLIQLAGISATLLTTAYAPEALLKDWMATAAEWNPATYILEGVRQGFVGSVTWADTWPAVVAALGLLALLGGFAVRGMRRFGVAA